VHTALRFQGLPDPLMWLAARESRGAGQGRRWRRVDVPDSLIRPRASNSKLQAQNPGAANGVHRKYA